MATGAVIFSTRQGAKKREGLRTGTNDNKAPRGCNEWMRNVNATTCREDRKYDKEKEATVPCSQHQKALKSLRKKY
ncbi:hypothetical protein EUGRSUZ_G02579 [Eucalyptus grandis]|uniref:Uncharacterized protein n=2 Tax=Eucalyptus grandis TaxID=71139 RepID=A0ACC3K6K7_EUCGR|nr:hypothetical protein EUGRSUZ_G02579 [Eucalyptus grandis]